MMLPRSFALNAYSVAVGGGGGSNMDRTGLQLGEFGTSLHIVLSQEARLKLYRIDAFTSS